jgi:hypothetical protein
MALWIGAFAQGFAVGVDRPELAVHTVLALAAAASTVLCRAWNVVFLLVARARFAAPAAASARRAALAAAGASLALVAAQFHLAGSLQWGSVSPAAHAALGAAVVVAHAVALVGEARALRLESAAPVGERGLL